ncbi:hypothetical protein D623_10002357 [Myotis brandtii]|uniref:Uncharacterized protein n=1 Tax=Myotis brandtii TaxID=109478 RepID=S7MZH5_MYOBR|nr:hypothetical protein D623_10002357 [Myotis brandtii]
MESLETFSPEEVAGGNLEIVIQVTEPEPELEPEPSGFGGEALDTCSIGGREYQVSASLQGKEEAINIVEDNEEEVKENVRSRRRRKQRKRPGGPAAPAYLFGAIHQGPLGSQISGNFINRVTSPIWQPQSWRKQEAWVAPGNRGSQASCPPWPALSSTQGYKVSIIEGK